MKSKELHSFEYKWTEGINTRTLHLIMMPIEIKATPNVMTCLKSSIVIAQV